MVARIGLAHAGGEAIGAQPLADVAVNS